MGAVVALLAILGLIVGWAFFAFQPQYANKQQLSVFNWTVIGACTMLCLAWLFNVGQALDTEVYDKYRAVFAIGGALGIEIVFLTACFLMRNFWIFKPPRRPGSGFFD